MFWNKYGKALVAVVLLVVTAVHAKLADGHVSQQEGVQIAIAGVTAFSVWLVPILTYPWVKTVVGVTLAVLNLLTTLIVGGISHGDLVELLMAALTALGVAAAPARSDPPMPDPVATPTVDPGWSDDL